MATNSSQIVSYYQALSGDEVKLVITGEPKGRLQQTDVLDPKVATEWGNKLGTPFGDMYVRRSAPVNRAAAKTPVKWSAWRSRAKYVTYIFSQASGPGRRISFRRTTP